MDNLIPIAIGMRTLKSCLIRIDGSILFNYPFSIFNYFLNLF